MLKKSTVKKRFAEREETIVKTAMDLFAAHGVEAVSIDMIADRAGIGKGTVYKHFSSKNDIYATLAIRHSDQMMVCLNRIPQDAPVLVQLKRTMREIWDFHISDIPRLAVFHKCQQLLAREALSPDLLILFEHQRHRRNQFIRGMIRKAIDEEIFVDTAMGDLTAVAVGLFSGVFELILQGEVEPSEALYQMVERTIFKGFIR